MNIIDLTHLITPDMPVYPGTEKPQLATANTYERDGFKETLLTMFSHTGTHMDAPAHLYKHYKCLDELDVSTFTGKAFVVDCTHLGPGEDISMDLILANKDLADQADFLLFNTGWSKHWGSQAYFGAYPCLTEQVIDYVIQSKKKGVGLDTIGLDPIKDGNLTLHKRLFSQHTCVIIENLTHLSSLGSGLVTLFALPLHFNQADGAPCRVIAIVDM